MLLSTQTMSLKRAKLTFCTHLHLITEIQGQSMLPILNFVLKVLSHFTNSRRYLYKRQLKEKTYSVSPYLKLGHSLKMKVRQNAYGDKQPTT